MSYAASPAVVRQASEEMKQEGSSLGKDASVVGAQDDKDEQGVLCLPQESMEILLAGGLGIYNTFKLSVACLLSIFVPQWCQTDNGGAGAECTIYDNLTELSMYNTFVVAWNFITLFVCGFTYFMLFRREEDFAAQLDEDPEVTNNYLFKKDRKDRTVLQLYPSVAEMIRRRNVQAFWLCTASLLFYLSNAVFSGVLIFYYYYDGFVSVTVFVTNFTMSLAVIATQWNYSFTGYYHDATFSMFKTDPACYNNIDRRIRKDPRYFIPRHDVAASKEIEMAQGLVAKLK